MGWEFDGRQAARGGDLSQTGRGGFASRELTGSTAASFMAGVYRWMTLGLVVTAGVALYVASQPNLARAVAGYMIPLIVVQLGVVLALSFLAQRMSGAVAGLLFLAYAALTGVTLSGIFFIYSLGSIGTAFLLTAGTFGALSLYGTITKRDLSAWGTFLFMGLIGVVLASFVQFFWHSAAFSFALSCATVVVFAGLTAYDTQKLRALGAQYAGAGLTSVTIIGALNLYLDFINLFLSLLRLFGDRRR